MADAMMAGIMVAAGTGDVGEVERLVGQDPSLLNGKGARGVTPLMMASHFAKMEVMRWLLDHGAAINERDDGQRTPLSTASFAGVTPVVRLLLERGADPTLADHHGWTPLIVGSVRGHLEVVRSLLGHPGTRAAINHRASGGSTALLEACLHGRGAIVKALLESGADPTIARSAGPTPMFVAKLETAYPEGVTAEDRRECVAALEVSFCSRFSLPNGTLPS
jgi:uncharacterized protein